MRFEFGGSVVEWRGPAPYYFVPVPEEECEEVRAVAGMASYGWGVVPVEVTLGGVGGVVFETSLFPKDGGYLLPLKSAVRKAHGVEAGDEVRVVMRVRVG
ncbi:DUF1905 domain-containing protein [Streptomyces sp. Ag109_O5-10]|uniref:DUF1905 domain-containing protein n=1 Tax=Streptomyces sp. Ag109_O5-10 TaxID=1855349 RepID=UPI00089870F8|nr:DUF1905 domain-containing protein [Streptomyces sp. Ag109_O5-10]SEF03580.1 protein of unknown function [Streptomyces sp. Ag109_O5-10]